MKQDEKDLIELRASAKARERQMIKDLNNLQRTVENVSQDTRQQVCIYIEPVPCSHAYTHRHQSNHPIRPSDVEYMNNCGFGALFDSCCLAISHIAL